MNNAELATIFENIADLLELKGENVFKVRAYQKAARAIERLPVEAALLLKEGKLREVPGVGESLAQKIEELLTSGHLAYYEELRREFPEGIITLMDIPGIGPKTALRLTRELNIHNVEELEKALQEGKVASLYRMGEKTAENILRSLQAFRRKERRIPLGQALPQVEEIQASLRQTPGLHNLIAAGSLRRFKETIGDIDLMGTGKDAEAIIGAFTSLPQVKQVLVRGGTKASVLLHTGLQVDLRVVDDDSFGSLLQYFTGSKEHNIMLRERSLRQGLSLSEYGITRVATGELGKFATEEDFYARLGLPYIPPELREGGNEVAKAEQRALPKLLELSDVKGDLHVHTNWSDGQNTLEEMVQAARARGYEYLAITDHSVGRGVAQGLSLERLRQQKAEIRALQEKYPEIHLLAGTEVDIRADGSLDYPDELLAELDWVVAAVHSAMNQDQERMTARVLRALKNPHVNALAHPTCRRLGEREPIALDMEALFQAARETNTALEINGMPDRLDLKDTHIYRARELGVKLVLATDAHAPHHLDFMRFGVGTARRGWCEARDILNTRPWEEFRPFLRRRD